MKDNVDKNLISRGIVFNLSKYVQYVQVTDTPEQDYWIIWC